MSIARDLARLRTPVQLEYGGIDPCYITGIIPYHPFDNSNTLTVTSGACYIPSLNKIVTFPEKVFTGVTGLVPDVFYHLYAFVDSNGNPDLELVQTLPSARYSGTARTKEGDTSRRFIAALRTGAGTTLYRFKWYNDGFIRYIVASNVVPFRLISGGTQTSATLVNASSLVPTSTITVLAQVTNVGTPVLQINHPDSNPTDVIIAVNAQGRQVVTLPTDDLRRFRFYNSGTGGMAYFDIVGYGNDR